MKKLIFFNQFHNGDCFVGKQYVASMVSQLLMTPSGVNVDFAYAHNNHPNIIQDLEMNYKMEHLSLNNIPPMDRMTRVAESQDKETIFVNTWVGCWQGTMFPFGEHINFQRLHNIWREYFKYFNLEFIEDPDYYLPTIDFESGAFDLSGAKSFLDNTEHFILICNGSANSGQSRVGNLIQTINILAEDLKTSRLKYKIVCTEKFDTPHDNVIFTSDIFGNKESDLNLIAYISTEAKLIVGKNSGPFSYCQFKDNLLDKDRTFLNLSILPTDCPSGGGAYPARCIFSPETNEERIANMINNILQYPHLRGTETLI